MTPGDVDVIIAAHDVRRFELLRTAVASVRRQSRPPRSIVVVVDHAPDLLRLAERELDATVWANDGARGASGARNAGARATAGPALAFLDDDVAADPGWLEALMARWTACDAPGVAGTIRPAWDGPPPAWFPDEFLWVVGASYRGTPTRGGRIRNGWSNNLGVRRDAFDAVGGFREGFGKLGGASDPEDTDLCLRINRLEGGWAWCLAPDATVAHHVPASRASASFFLRRCLREGRSKALLRALDGDPALSAEATYLRAVLPRAIARGFADTVRGKPTGLARAGATVTGLAATSIGYLLQRASAYRGGGPRG